MTFTAREWLQLYESSRRQIQQRRRGGSGLSDSEGRALKSAIATLSSQLKIMQSNLMEYEIAASEVARRQTLLENLQKQLTYVAIPSSQSGGAPMEMSSNPLQTSDKGLVQRQQDVMRMQDDMLQDIGKGVDRLYGQATTIGEETKTHIKLLDNLEGHVDDATDALTSEAKHAEEVRRKAQGCYMYICIAIEFVIILLLLVIGFA
mmetsp:Transcript_12743/g.19193  ORF Transcript_12743/g.19193 Transcript_12743/m.19193 type:complete len:205 (+) Transcript_12743:55-669(+)|eukprot:CAMPEP_0185017836 /NCGR_PEP_ID=MMETSP1103-20130426/716_1 /TAXON_ID=36769 /ORGANISM="Paraphysomonas bandaiensis, Strain Caron Lab Isolate" /LENGTH=204 /DNA_ID=CAMNT_0027547423 /DNA_START=41 /DNA_END=655 /DNA_ORIENTATION=+